MFTCVHSAFFKESYNILHVYKAFLKYLYTDVVDHLSLEETFGEFKYNAKINCYCNS